MILTSINYDNTAKYLVAIDFIFDFPEEAIAKIVIDRPNETLEFVRTDNSNRPWQMKKPEDVPASDATVSFLVDLLVRGERDRAFSIPISQLKEVDW
jgi:hypothetical protein